MMEKKRVLVCGIRDFGSRTAGRYYMTKEGEELKFCEGIVLGEGGAKKILSCVEIDEIIAIGSSNQCVESKDGKALSVTGSKMKLNDGIGNLGSVDWNLCQPADPTDDALEAVQDQVIMAAVLLVF